MFGFRSRIGYQSIEDESTESRIYSTDNEQTLLIPRNSVLEDDGPSEVYGSPPLEHDIAANEVGGTVECHAATSSGILWDGVENLDQFFTRVYEYHQNGGYLCIVIKHILTLFQFIFVVWFVTFLLVRVDYDVLFKNKNISAEGKPIGGKIRLEDVIYPDWSHIGGFTLCLLVFAVLFWIFRAARVFYQIYQFSEIRTFYHSALGIEDTLLSDLKWQEVVQLICEKQPSIHLILNKDGITALDLYQRILRHKNYFVALINKEILPPVINVPFIGSMPYLPNGLKMNLEWLLFYGVWSPWKGPYELKEEYKHPQNIFRLADELDSAILKMAIGNFIFFPLVFVYQVLYFFFTYGELLKRDPGSFAMRRYSNYGRNKLRHFNELDHELRIRLSKSHRAATQYMEQFLSPLGQVIARKMQFVASAICIVLLLLGLWDEDVLSVEHVLTIISLCGLIAVACQSLIGDENMIYWPETLLNMVIAHIHYAPDSWKGKAHTDTVRREFGHLFELKAKFLLEELLSPVLTPFVLLFWIRPKAKEFVDFFHNFTVSVEGLGDVCSFAQMDIRQHGDPNWSFDEVTKQEILNMHGRVHANDGKTELSLIHFASNHPEWKPPPRAARFLDDIRSRMTQDINTLKDGVVMDDNILLNSLHSFNFNTDQQLRRFIGGQPSFVSFRNPDLFSGAANMSLHGERKNHIGDMVLTSQTTALSIVYLRNLHANYDNRRLEIVSSPTTMACRHVAQISPISPTVAPIVVETTVRGSDTVVEAAGSVWGVPAQSAISPLQASLSPRSDDEQLQQEITGDEQSPPGLSHNILNV
ncbi:Autophagy protein Apg9 containing protein [Brugia malayi]|uniref:Autophagy-related protein 9 n=3 Tax=Brugia malayi TaxID=6279 RepID=A0A1P6BJC5_BRUMA|nr:Autophagy protein Apg9 containing protein [Brugia malayi]CRZ22734.1 BMA-ATG-9 [Brugia malayi]VIO97685.1 Autophagy protein Apg9 containing protein [Brugia malayi]